MLLKNYRLFINLIILPFIIYNPIGGGFPIGFGGWGVYIWPYLVVALLTYVILYHYLYLLFWNWLENNVIYYINIIYSFFFGFFSDPSFDAMYIENILRFIEFLCYYYFLYFLFIM